MKKIFLLLGFSLSLTLFGRDYRVSDFGLVPDGVTLNTVAFQQAIDSIAGHGGGRLVFSAGRYVTGTVYLKSGVELHLQSGATLLGSLSPWDYIRDPYAGWTALILAVGQDSIAITGSGTIDGRGFEVATRKVDYVHRGLYDDPLRNDRIGEAWRPEIIHLCECSHVRIAGITLRNPACWTQQYDRCSYLTVDGIKVDAKCYWNNDGIDVVDCSHVRIRNCYIDSSDDAYCFKSHRATGISEDVIVENCVGRSSANGIKFGTVTRGIMRHFVFRNITIYDTYRSALTIASVDGARIEDIVVDGLRSIHTGNPFFIRLASRHVGDSVPYLKDIVIRNMYAEVPFDKPDAGYNYEGPVEDLPRNVCPSSILGVPGMRIENVRIENAVFVHPGKADSTYAYRGHSPQQLQAIPELERSYPEFSNWKEMPAWGLYMRHADGIALKNVVFRLQDQDYRPVLVADDVTDIDTASMRTEYVQAAAVEMRSPCPEYIPLASRQPLLQDSCVLASCFGIKSNGTTLNTGAIQHAIDYISAHGGGTLVFRVGRYLTGSLHLRSNVSLHLSEGAILVASPSIHDYEQVHDQRALLIADRVHDVHITGEGGIEMNTETLAGHLRSQQESGALPMTGETVPIAMYMHRCRRVTCTAQLF